MSKVNESKHIRHLSSRNYYQLIQYEQGSLLI